MTDLKSIKKAANYIKNKTRINKYDIAVVFGSGLSPDPNEVSGIHISYKSIPHFPISSVSGHAGRLISFAVDQKKILFFLGRVHFYEGYSPKEVVFPIRIMNELGVKKLILTNASGAINKKYKIGDLMIIKDHINFTGVNPLVGPNIKEHGERFTDMTQPYSQRLSNLARKHSHKKLKEGVYIGVSGPSYETKSEISFFRKAGADAVGMSTVLESITANHCNIETLGISCITNTAADITSKKIKHEDVLNVTAKAKTQLLKIIMGVLKEV